MIKKWIQKALEKPGTLHKQLGIDKKDKIPRALLKKIMNANKNATITNPTKKGKRKIKATPLLKKRANLALNLKNIKK